METQFGTAIEAGNDSHAVGERAARTAVGEMATDRVDFCQVFASARYEYRPLLDGIRSVVGPGASVVGCSTAGEFTESRVTESSVALAVVASDSLQFCTGLGTGLSENVTACAGEAIRQLPSSVEGHPYMSAIALHDGLVGAGEQLALACQRKLGQHVSLAGGSAGDDMGMAATHVFCDGDIVEDALAMALIAAEQPITLTVNHAHTPVSAPVTVTAAEGSTVREIDDRPAFEVWLDAVREPVGERLGVDVDSLDPGSERLSELLNHYPFGIDQGHGFKIRWPGLTERTDGPMQFAVEIPEGTVFRVMHSQPSEQVSAVREATREAVDAAGEIGIAGAFVYDCVCRAAILGDEFAEAITAIDEELPAPFVGFETYGELCLQRGQTSGYHNTTSVVMLLPE